MDSEQQSGMQTKWMLKLLAPIVGICFFEKLIGGNCYPQHWISNLSLIFSLVGGLVLLGAFLAVLNKYNFMVIDNAIDDTSSAKKLSSFTIFCYVFCVFMFGSIIVGEIVNSGLDLMILITSNKPIEFKTHASDVDTTSKSGRGSCHGVEYTFHNSPVNRDTRICDTQNSLAFLKNGDVILVREKVGAVGVNLIDVQFPSS